MKKIFAVLLGLTLAASLFSMSSQWTLQPTENITQPVFSPDSGTPDTFGYVYVTSGDPGGPTFNWIDISTIGTEVSGLHDDNVVGPFPLGFDFPFYWYIVDQLYIGSNGNISFSSNANWAPWQTWPVIPSAPPLSPPDLVQIYVEDLNFDEPADPHCYIYTSATLDTFIMSFVTVPEWNVSSASHTFQLILTKSDSCLLMQYGLQVGVPPGLVGIENCNGSCGLQYYRQGVAGTGAVLPDSGIAVIYIPPVTTSFEAHDVGVAYIDNSTSGGIFRDVSTDYTPTVNVKNYGNQMENTFDVICELRYRSGPTIIYADTLTISTLAPGCEELLTFTSLVLPASDSNFRLFARTFLTGDMAETNDSLTLNLRTLTPPAWLGFGLDTAVASGSAWSGDSSGYGNEFVPPVYPFTVDSIGLFVASTYAGGSGDLILMLLDDNGTNNAPGDTLFADTVFVNTNAIGWKKVAVNPTVEITDGKFYVGGLTASGNSFYTGICNFPPGAVSRRAWEYTGSWAPSRDAGDQDVYVIAHGSWTSVGIEEGVEIGNTEYRFVGPSVISGKAFYSLTLSENSNVNINVFDLSGRQVQTLYSGLLNAGTHNIGFDNSQISSGVYFIRADVNGQTESVKINIIQ